MNIKNEMFDACNSGNIDRVKKLLESRFLFRSLIINSRNFNGYTPVMIAAEQGFHDLARLLLSYRAEVNYSNNEGDTPVHLAVKNGNEEMVELLGSNGANVNILNDFGETPLFIAIKTGNRSLVRCLKKYGAF